MTRPRKDGEALEDWIKQFDPDVAEYMLKKLRPHDEAVKRNNRLDAALGATVNPPTSRTRLTLLLADVETEQNTRIPCGNCDGHGHHTARTRRDGYQTITCEICSGRGYVDS